MARQATDFLHEDIEDLLKFGATYEEIIERGGYCDWNTMQKSFKRRGRTDLLEAMQAKKANARNVSLSSSPIFGGKHTRSSLSLKQG